MKKLKLKIVKFDRLLVVEQLEGMGEWKNSEHVKVDGNLFLFDDHIDLQENIGDRSANCIEFDDDAERDDYLQKMLGWITEEQFGGAADSTERLEVGELCWVSNDEGDWDWYKRIFAGRIAKQLGLEKRFLTLPTLGDENFECWKCAKPINDCLKIDGEIYTWKIK